MTTVYKLIIPERLEALLYLLFAPTILSLQSYKSIKLFLDNATNTVAADSGDLQIKISIWTTDLLNKIDPRWIDFLVWLLVGCIVFMIASVIIASIKTTEDETRLLQYYRSPKGKRHEINAFVTKATVRMAGAIGAFLWLIVFLTYINKTLVNFFFNTLVNIKEPASWLWMPIIIMMFAAAIYVFTIMLRLVFLKIRIFSNQEE